MPTITEENAPRILVIDDNRAIHTDFAKVLACESVGGNHLADAEAALFGDEPSAANSGVSFRLDSAFQGQDGLAMVKEGVGGGRPFAMAFVDVRMPPGWDGIETTARLWEVDPDLQIVICTAYSDYSWDEMLGKLNQPDRLIILKKPFDHIEVLQLATSLTRKWQLLQETRTKVADLETKVTARATQLAAEQEKLTALFENCAEGIFQTSADGRFLNVNSALAAIYGYASARDLREQLCELGRSLYVDPARHAEFQRRLEKEYIVRDFDSEICCPNGSHKWIRQTAWKVLNADASLRWYQGFVVDVTNARQAS